jgi:Domain of unknown function (DUF4340)
MNKRQVIILWIIAIALGGAVGIVKLTQKDTTKSATQRASGETLFDSFPGADVSSVAIQGADGKVTLAKKDGAWVVSERDNYPANGSYVNDFIRTLTELKVTRGMEAGPSFAPRFGMDEGATTTEARGLTAAFSDASGKEIARVSLGKNIESGQDAGPMGGAMSVGRYIRNHADETGFYAVSEMFPSVSAEAQRWLNTDFISPDKVKSISITQKGKEDIAWKLVRETEEAEYKLEGAAGSEVLDTTVTSPLKSVFSYARFDDVVPADKVAEKADTANKQTVVLETVEGFRYTIGITPVKESTDKMYVTVAVTGDIAKERKKEEGEKPEDAKTKDEAFATRVKDLNDKLAKEQKLAGRTFEVAKTTVDSLLKERDQLITKATPPAPADAGAPSVQTLPGGVIASPPMAPAAPPANTPPTPKPPKQVATTPPIEAVTPPIAVPPLEEEKKEGEKKDGE